MNQDMINSLREALNASPDNHTLRNMLAEALLEAAQLTEAEEEFNQVISKDPGNTRAKIGLSKTLVASGKPQIALVILEEIIESNSPTPETHLLYAELLLDEGEDHKAAKHYRLAIEGNTSLATPELDARFRNASKVPSWVEGEDEEFEGSEIDHGMIEKPKINFSHIGGMDKVKEEIRMKIIEPMNQPELYAAFGKKIGGGILLYGPPGCGKTHIARATAGEINANFINVGLTDVLSMWIGESENNLKSIFEEARERRPCVLFFDEVDALGASRSDMRQSSGRHIINQFLAEMDGMDADNEGLLVLGATNTPWHLDPAFRRPGRFDRIIFVPPPDAPAREKILQIHMEGKPQESIRFQKVASKTKGFSGADLKNLIDMTVEEKLRESMKKGRPMPIGTKDLLNAYSNLKPTTKEWFNTARNYALYANESGLYDEILNYLKLN